MEIWRLSHQTLCTVIPCTISYPRGQMSHNEDLAGFEIIQFFDKQNMMARPSPSMHAPLQKKKFGDRGKHRRGRTSGSHLQQHWVASVFIGLQNFRVPPK